MSAVTSKKKSKEKGNLAVSSDEEDSKKGDRSDNEDEDGDDDFGFDPERYVPFNEKCDFSDAMRRVSKEGLTMIVEYLSEKQPEAIEDIGNDRLSIKVDAIERQQFDYCKDLLNQH